MVVGECDEGIWEGVWVAVTFTGHGIQMFENKLSCGIGGKGCEFSMVRCSTRVRSKAKPSHHAAGGKVEEGKEMVRGGGRWEGGRANQICNADLTFMGTLIQKAKRCRGLGECYHQFILVGCDQSEIVK